MSRLSDIEKILEEVKKAGIPFKANDTLGSHIDPKAVPEIQKNVEYAVELLLKALVIDTDNDHNTKETAKRVAKMYVTEVFKGRYLPRPAITEFPNVKKLDELYTVGPITVRSACSHHLVPIIGKAWIGVVPSDKVVGLSKFHRLTEWVMSRPHIQEEAAIMLADEIEEIIKPKGLAVVIRAEHMCMSWRGVKDVSTMSNCVVRGLFAVNPSLKAEFYETIRGQDF